jgi:hypothetical protein
LSITRTNLKKKKQINKQTQTHTRTGRGTIGWQSPEQILGQRVSKKSDIFALGCLIFYVLMDGQHPFGEVCGFFRLFIFVFPFFSGFFWIIFIDIFALGCLFIYVLMRDVFVLFVYLCSCFFVIISLCSGFFFLQRFERESNIVQNQGLTDRLEQVF